MRGFDIVTTIIIVVFFVAGIGVGALLVIALPLIRYARWESRKRRRNGGDWWKMPPPHDDGKRSPRWPGG